MVEPECVAEERRTLGEMPLQSPISAPRPGFGPETIEPGAWTRREILGYVVWGSIGLVIAVFECLAAFGTTTPWPTLSSTVGKLERDHNWIAIVVLSVIVVLGARIVFYPWPNRQAEK
jgi:magnesium-transporting ATPase (P-type)